MTYSDTLPSDVPAGHVVIRCPGCGAADTVAADAVAGQPTIVCRECGETWPAAMPERVRHKTGKSVRRRKDAIEAEKKALVSYSDRAADNAWKAKIEGDYWAEPPRHSRLPMFAAAAAALLFFAAFFGGREAAVAALPDLAGLYSAIGLPVNLDGFAIETVNAERVPTFGGTRLKVHATLRNVAGGDRTIPPLATVLYSDALVPAGAYGFDPPVQAVAKGQSVALLMELDIAPKAAAEVVVRFRRRGETLAVAGAAQSIVP